MTASVRLLNLFVCYGLFQTCTVGHDGTLYKQTGQYSLIYICQVSAIRDGKSREQRHTWPQIVMQHTIEAVVK